MEFDLKKYNYKAENGKLIVTEKRESVQEWIKQMHKAYISDRTVISAGIGAWTFVVDDEGNVSKACCSKNDTYNTETGIAIAYAKLKGIPLHPDLLKEKEETKEEKKEETYFGFKLGEKVIFTDGCKETCIATVTAARHADLLIAGVSYGHSGVYGIKDIIAGKWEHGHSDYWYALPSCLRHIEEK